MTNENKLENILNGIRSIFENPTVNGKPRINELNESYIQITNGYLETISNVEKSDKEQTTKGNLGYVSLLREYNSKVDSDQTEQDAFINDPSHIRVTVPSRDHSASASYRLYNNIYFEQETQGMFFIIPRRDGIYLFPKYNIKPEQATLLDDVFNIQGRNIENGRTRERVIKISKPAFCHKTSEGVWRLGEKGEIIVEPILRK
jgi:hypothetical protein